MAGKSHRWTFQARFRARAFGWRSALPIRRVREAVAEIERIAKKDPVLGAEGAVRFLERVSPAIEPVDSSSGAIGSAVNRAIDRLVPLIAAAPADGKTRDRWLDRLWQAFQDDEIPYLETLGDHWGELAGSPERASRWADELLPTLEAAWSDPAPGAFFRGTGACLSSLLAAGRTGEMLALLEAHPRRGEFYLEFGFRALAAEGRIDDAIAFARKPRRDIGRPGVSAAALERVLLDAGRREEAYELAALPANRRSTHLATFRAIAAKYPEKEQSEILADLIRESPDEEGKWFATAKHLGDLDLALRLARTSPVDPRTLTRAARDHLESHPGFAREAALAALRWIEEGYGYKITGSDVAAARDLAQRAAARLKGR